MCFCTRSETTNGIAFAENAFSEKVVVRIFDMSKTVARILFYFLAVGICLVFEANAQVNSDGRRTLSLLNREIERVEELARSYNNNSREVAAKIAEAKTLRDRAASLIVNNRLALAKAAAEMAFQRLSEAKRLILRNTIQRIRSKLEDRLRRADELIGDLACHQEARRTLNDAKKNRDAGERAFNSGQIDLAIEHFRVGNSLAETAIDQLNNSGGADIDRITDEKAKFESLVARAREKVEQSQNSHAQQILQQGVRLANRAQDAIRDCNFDLAKSLLNQSSLLLLRAMDLASPMDAGQAEVALHRLRDDIVAADRILGDAAVARAKLLFERAKRFAAEAEQALHEKHNHAALWKIDLARKMLQRATTLARGRRALNDRLPREIENTRQDIASVRSNMSDDAPPDARVLVRMSEFALQRAEQGAAAGTNRVAFEAIWAAQELLSRAERILSKRDQEELGRNQVEVKLKQLDAVIQESEPTIAEVNQDWSRQLFSSAKELRKLAEDSLQKGNYRAANEAIQVSFGLLRKSLKNLRKE